MRKAVGAHSDSAFTRESDTGYGLRGCNIVRRGTGPDKQRVYHLLERPSKSHKLACRNAFASYVLAASSIADDLMAVVLTLHEMHHGLRSAAEAKQLVETCTLDVLSVLITESMSTYAALAMTITRVPNEKSLAVHTFWLKDLLVTGKVSAIGWRDTRDMTADGHTTGMVALDMLIGLQNGEWKPKHQLKFHSPQGGAAIVNQCYSVEVFKPRKADTTECALAPIPE